LFTRDYTDFFDLQESGDSTRGRVRRDFLSVLEGDLQAVGMPAAGAARAAGHLWDAMTAPARHYHTPVHVLAMFQYAQRSGIDLSPAERLAIWFHDSVYDASAPNGRNEADSARWMTEALGDCADGGLIIAASQMILSTAHHTCDPLPVEHHRVLDLDLAGFTAPSDTFDRQSAALRREFAHLPDARYACQTTAFLRALLARRSIFRTEPFAASEAAARSRIQQEIRRLESNSGL
jgi:predicted metal-dependent HD superfamily phosphohydrolase